MGLGVWERQRCGWVRRGPRARIPVVKGNAEGDLNAVRFQAACAVISSGGRSTGGAVLAGAGRRSVMVAVGAGGVPQTWMTAGAVTVAALAVA